ncbi:MAG: post-transcriptional regulator [bacterium]|nr:post-transcriptional regulator [bacterium]
MEEFKFNSLNELFNRLYPAFNTKVNELKNDNIIVSEIMLWNFLKENNWFGNTTLTLYDMVEDIFSLDKEKLIKYLERNKNDNNK